MWVQHCRLLTVKQQKWPCEIHANTSHKRASPTILVLVVRAWSTHILQLKYYWRTHLGFFGLKSNFLKATLLLAPPKKLCITYRSKRCAHFISVQRNTDRKRLHTALFPRDFRTILKEPRPFFSPTAMSTLFKRCYLCFCAPAIASLLLRTICTSRQAARESRHWGYVYSAADSWTLIGRFYSCAAPSSVVIGSNGHGAFTVARKILEIVVQI